METIQNQSTKSASNKMSEWFEGIIHSIKTDKLQLETNPAPEEKKDMYAKFIDGNFEEVMSSSRNFSSQFFIMNLMNDYLTELKDKNLKVKNLGFDLSNSSVLVWAEINDNDESTEDGLILTEALINAKYSEKGFYISSTIVEKGDNIPIPSQYSIIKE